MPQINQYPNTATSITDADWMDLDKNMGGGVFQSQKVSLPILADSLTAYMPPMENMSNANLDFDMNHGVDGNGFSWALNHFSNLTLSTGEAPQGGDPSIVCYGYGTTLSDITHELGSSSGITMNMYGDSSTRFYGRVQSDGRLVVGYDQDSLPSGTWGNTFAAPSGATKAFTVGTTGLTSDLFTILSNGQWMIGALSGPTHSMGRNADNHYIFNASGKGLLIGADNDSVVDSAIVEIRSTSRGFLPPVMTTAQMMAIPTPAIGLLLYVTDLAEGLYVSKSTGWTLVA